MRKKILLIDNDQGILDVMQEALNYEGYDVHAVDETDDIMSLVNEHQPDLLLIDYLLNGINGGELCHQLKINKQTCLLPVIIISAYPQVLQSLGNYGCNVFIPKPFDLFYLLDQINTLSDQSIKIYN